jgi:diguanylate cyclase (GGDEF)-like protein
MRLRKRRRGPGGNGAPGEDGDVQAVLRDPLTGLPTRALISDRLELALARGRRRPSLTALIYVDIDQLDRVNDRAGRPAGDALLAEIGHRLSELLRPSDTVARFGDDEFLVLAEDVVDADGAGAVAKRLATAFDAPFRIGATELAVTATMGMALSHPGVDTPETLISEAHTALFEAKQHGGGQIGVYRVETQKPAPRQARPVEEESTSVSAGLASLPDAIRLIGTEPSISELLGRIVQAACSLVDARCGGLAVMGDGGELRDFITEGIGAAELAGVGEVLSIVVNDGRPLDLANVADHSASSRRAPVTSFLGVPIWVRDEVFGGLYLGDKQGAPKFTRVDHDLVVTLAAAAGVAIENAQLQSQVRGLAVIEDRERIARQLHDTVVQRLFGVGMLLEGAGMAASKTNVQDRIEQAVKELDTTIREIRSSIFALRGVTGPGLRVEVATVAADLAPLLTLQPRVRFAGDVDRAFPLAITEELIDTLRDALLYAARHARATTIDVELRVDDEIVLRVVDNGVAKGRRNAERLKARTARARELGGDVRTESRAGKHALVWRVSAPDATVVPR